MSILTISYFSDGLKPGNHHLVMWSVYRHSSNTIRLYLAKRQSLGPSKKNNRSSLIFGVSTKPWSQPPLKKHVVHFGLWVKTLTFKHSETRRFPNYKHNLFSGRSTHFSLLNIFAISAFPALFVEVFIGKKALPLVLDHTAAFTRLDMLDAPSFTRKIIEHPWRVPENEWLEDVFPIKMVPFKGTC